MISAMKLILCFGILCLVGSGSTKTLTCNSLRIFSDSLKNIDNELDQDSADPTTQYVDDIHLHFTGTPKSVEVQNGQSLVLECGANGVPQSKIHWLRNGKRVYQSAHEDDDNSFEKVLNVGTVTIQNSITMSTLKIDCVTPAMTGDYVCVADNGYQKIATPEATVKVSRSGDTQTKNCLNAKRNIFMGQGPQIYMWTDSRFEVSGASVQLFCRAKGYPEPVIYWLDNEDQVVTSAKKYAVLSNGDLLIKKVDWGMMGQFTCVASNEFGKDTKQTFLYPTASENSASSETL